MLKTMNRLAPTQENFPQLKSQERTSWNHCQKVKMMKRNRRTNHQPRVLKKILKCRKQRRDRVLLVLLRRPKRAKKSSETKLTEHANVAQKPIEKREVSTDGTSEPKEVEVNASSHPVEPEAKSELSRHSAVEMAKGSTRKTTEAQLEIVSNKFPTNEEHKEWFAQDSTKSQGSKHVSFEAEKKQLRITKPTTPPPLSQEVKIADTGITVSLKSRWPRGFPSQEEQQSEPCLEAALEKEEAAYDSGDELAILPTDEQDYGTLKDYWNKAASKRTPQGLDPEEELARSLSVKKFSKLTSSFTGAQKDEDIDTGIYMEDKDNE
mmetsp:Transcript_41203/g.57943  ORF Transcript_41203/g.57943 Transcript_41203/m.57943 type:complete len:321 (-) Transcript_41203:94-1056(-)